MKSVFAPILLGGLVATLAATGAPAQPNPQQEHAQPAAQRTRAEHEAQRDRAQAQAERARARREAQSDRAKQEAQSDRAKQEAQSDRAKQEAQSGPAKQEAQSNPVTQSNPATQEAQSDRVKREARHDRIQREERRDRETSHEPTILLTDAIPARPAPPLLAAIPAPAVSEEIGAHAAVQFAPEMGTPRARVPLVLSASAGADLAAIRGDQLMREGEIAAARLLYEQAAAAGNAHAAVGLGRSYDPSVLSGLGADAAGGDALIAAIWYKRARLMGSHEADISLEDQGISRAR